MATISLQRDNDSGSGVGITWAAMANGDDGQAWDTKDFPDVSVHVIGTFGAGGNLRIQGSNEPTPTNWATLSDPQGNVLDITSAKLEQVLEGVRWIRPAVTAGDGTTAITVRLWGGRRR